MSTLLTRVRLMRGENHRELVGVTLKEERNRLETVSLLGPGQTEACAPAPKPAEAKKEDHKQ